MEQGKSKFIRENEKTLVSLLLTTFLSSTNNMFKYQGIYIQVNYSFFSKGGQVVSIVVDETRVHGIDSASY